MQWLSSKQDRQLRALERIHSDEVAFLQTVYSTVVELVHPGNLGPLPPSPERLIDKALQLGLIQYTELRAFNERRLRLHY